MFKLAIFTLLLVARLDTAVTETSTRCPFFECPSEKREVCGTDLVTYQNRCVMLSRNCGEDDLFYTGACRPPSECDIRVRCVTDFIPVCGTDGNTYRNSCIMLSQRCREVTVAYKGECRVSTQTVTECPKLNCSSEVKEVCGTDGVTYSNRCYMLLNNCGRDDLFYTGPCRPASECDIQVDCAVDFFPVCGNDGNTYRNSCFMFLQRCREVTKAYEGECHPSTQTATECPNLICTLELKEVCALNRVTYSNRCIMMSSHCGQDELLYTGPCIPQSDCDIRLKCLTDYYPVCATDGNTYRNWCLMFTERCREVTVAHNGECQS